MDELLAAAVQAMNAPESMVERSAEARARALGVTVEDVLRAWSGGGEIASDAGTAAHPAPEPKVTPAEPGVAVPAVASVSTLSSRAQVAIIAAAAEKMGLSESMVKRSATARAKAHGVDVDAVLMEWAGVDLSSADASTAPAPAASTPTLAVPTPPAVAQSEVEVTEISDPETQSESEVVDSSESESLPPEGAFPRWLAALFVFVPMFAIAYALFLPNGPNCGDAGSLEVDPVSGLAVNCDGSEFGSGIVDFFALGAEVYDGIGCTACHGPNGGGVATFPAFTGGALLATFPEDSCAEQIDWISLGTAEWPDPTYGANAKPVGGSGAVMPGFGASLSTEEIAAVALYERVAFGGQDLDAALVDCGGSPVEGDTAASGE